jgi:hypothetical protein
MSAAAAPPPAPPAEARISALGRITGVLFNPKETFADIARKPSWVLPVVLLTVLGLAFAYTMNQRIDWRAFIGQQIDKSPRAADMSAEQRAQAIDMQARFTPPFVYFIGGCGTILSCLILGLLYWLGMNLFGGGGVRFGQSFAIVAHSELTGLVSAPLGMLIMFLKSYGDVNPENIMATSLGAFLPENAPRALASVGASIEVFWFWSMFLLATGYCAVNPRKLPFGKALGIIVGIWIVWVFIKAGAATIFG